MQRCLVIFLFMLYGFSSRGQSITNNIEAPNARFVGGYEMEGTVIQFSLQKEALVLIVPGAPVQNLENVGKNEFKSTVFKDQHFVFVEHSGKVTEVISEQSGETFRGKKIT